MSGEDKVLGLNGGITTVKSLEDNLHSYTNNASAVAVGDVVYQDGSVNDKVVTARSSTASSSPPIGVVSEIVDTTNCIVCHSGGIVTGLSGLTRGAKYWLTDIGTSGNTLQSSEPTSNKYLVGVALSASSLLITLNPFSLDGEGDISGPGSSTDTAIAKWSGTGGDTLSDSGVLIDASDNISGIVSMAMEEQTSPPSTSAGNGYLWTKQHNGATGGNRLYFTDDTGQDYPPMRTVALERTINADSNFTVEIGSITHGGRPTTISMTIQCGTGVSTDGLARYEFIAHGSFTSGAYEILTPTHTTHPVTGNGSYSAQVEVSVDATTASFRIRGKGFAVSVVARITIIMDGDENFNFSPSSTSVTTTEPTAFYPGNILTQATRIQPSAGGIGTLSTYPFFMLEAAAAQPDNAGYGQIWVKDDAPNTLYFTDDSGTDWLLNNGPSSSVDNSIIRFDGTTGAIQGGATNNNVILDDSGSLSPEVDDGGALGTSSRTWSDIYLSNGGEIIFDNGLTKIVGDSTTSTGDLIFYSEDKLIFYSDSDTISPRLQIAGIDEPTLQIINFLPSRPTTYSSGFTGVWSSNYLSGEPSLIATEPTHTAADSLETVITGAMNGIAILVEEQLGNFVLNSYIRQAVMFLVSGPGALDDSAGDTFTITDGSTTETWTAVNIESATFEFAVGADVVESLENLTQAINDDSTEWGAVQVPNSLATLLSGFSGLPIVIYRKNQIGAGEDRVYGTFSAARVFIYDHSEDPDYRKITSTNTTALPSSDPVTRNFGPGRVLVTQGLVTPVIMSQKLFMADGVAANGWVEISKGPIDGSTGSVDNALIRADGGGGTTIQGGATSDGVILDDTGNLYPETDDGGSLGLSTNKWSDLFLAAGAQISFNNGDVGLQNTATNELSFLGAADGYKFNNGPILIDDVALSSVQLGYTGLFGDTYYNTRPNLVMVQNGDSSTNQLQRNLWGPLGNAILHSRQLKPAGAGARIAQANFFFLTATAAVSDTFTISDGTTTETWTAVGGAPGVNQFDQSGTLAQNLESLASQINTDSSTWGAAWVGQSLANIHIGATAGGIVIYRMNPLSSGDDRIYGSFASPSTARSFDFSGDVDYRRVDLSNADVQLPSTDPAAKTFGFNITSGDAVKQGDTYISILDNSIWSANKFVGNYIQLGGAAFMARVPQYLGDQMSGGADFSESPPLPLSPIVARNEGTATGITTMSAIFSGKSTIATTDYFLACYRGNVRMGGVRGNGDGTTVIYEAFSGGHIGQTSGSSIDSETEELYDGSQIWEPGMILVSTGIMCSNPDTSEINYQPQLALSSSANQNTVVGVYSGASMGEWAGCNPNMPISNYAALGRGRVLVTDEGGNVNNGDLIVTSGTAGYGMKQADNVMRSTTVAKCFQQIDWANITESINGHKAALVACFIYCG